MFYANQSLGAVGVLFCDMYYAVNIDDFVHEKNQIPEPTRWKLISPLTWGSSKDVFIFLNNVTLQFTEGGYTISDLTNTLLVNPAVSPGLNSLLSAAHKNLSEGRYHEIVVRYSLADDKAYLHSTEKFGPPTPDTQTDVGDSLEHKVFF